MTSSLLIAAFIAFAATTVDDLIIVTALFTTSRTTGHPRPTAIIAGQYIGFIVIIAISLAAAEGLRAVPDHWVGLLGFVPIAFGLRGLWHLRHRDQDPPPLAATTTAIAAVTFANGADNIGVFTPLFRSMHLPLAIVTSIGFLVLVAAWCALGALLGTHRAVIATLGRISHWLVPVVFLLIGTLILTTTGALGFITTAL